VLPSASLSVEAGASIASTIFGHEADVLVRERLGEVHARLRRGAPADEDPRFEG